MERIIWHWSAGGHKANATDKKHYHIIIEGDANVVLGNHPISANEVIDGPYAAHTRSLNTGSIGVALAAMRGAKERPFSPGPSPITDAQVEALVEQTAKLCRQFNIPVTRQTVLSHAEVEPTLGVKQRNKWDITWLPGMTKVGDPVAIGDALRTKVDAKLRETRRPPAPMTELRKAATPKPNPIAAMISALLKIFRGNA